MILSMQMQSLRAFRVMQFFLKRSSAWCVEYRCIPAEWSIAHMISVAQMMRLLALVRGLEPDISAIAGIFHDITTMETGEHQDHALHSPPYIKELVQAFNTENPQNMISKQELALLLEIVPLHSDKKTISENPYAEMLKDADAIDRYLHGIETKPHEVPRLQRALASLGIEATAFKAQ